MMPSRSSTKLNWLLCSLADPLDRSLVKENLLGINPQSLIAALGKHGIEPVGLRKLKPLVASDPNSELAQLLRESSERQILANAHSMELEARAETILSEVQKTGVRAAIVKGPDFAANLYPNRSDRPFTDIDFLIPPADLGMMSGILKSANYTQVTRSAFDRSKINMEQKWTSPDNQNILIELHTNLVHDPGLRRRLSFGYSELETACQGKILTPVARFLIAVIHAAAGHKFHKLQLLVDVLQAFRNLDPSGVEQLYVASNHIPVQLETATCLGLISELFSLPSAGEVASKFKCGLFPDLPGRILFAGAILEATGARYGSSHIRRHAFRILQKVSSRPRVRTH